MCISIWSDELLTIIHPQAALDEAKPHVKAKTHDDRGYKYKRDGYGEHGGLLGPILKSAALQLLRAV